MLLTCPGCGNTMPSDAAFCDQCGAPMARDPAPAGQQTGSQRCPRCQTPHEPGQAFCEQCGHALAARPSRPQPASPSTGLRCPQCNSPFDAGDAFCTQCGYRPDTETGPTPGTQETLIIDPPSARLIMKRDGSAIALPDKSEILIGREDPMNDYFPDIDLTPFGGSEQGVSRRHARILKRADGYFIEDLNSTNYTFVNQEKLVRGQQRPLKIGDELRFGRVVAGFQIE